MSNKAFAVLALAFFASFANGQYYPQQPNPNVPPSFGISLQVPNFLGLPGSTINNPGQKIWNSLMNGNPQQPQQPGQFQNPFLGLLNKGSQFIQNLGQRLGFGQNGNNPNQFPGMGSQQPQFPGMGSQFPGMGPQFPGMGPQFPGMGSQFPGMGSQFPGMGSQFPGMGSQFPGMGSQFPGMGSQQPQFPGMGQQSQFPGTGPQQPQFPGMGSEQPQFPGMVPDAPQAPEQGSQDLQNPGAPQLDQNSQQPEVSPAPNTVDESQKEAMKPNLGHTY